MNTTVYILGILLQFIAAIIALVQVPRTPRKLPWMLIALSSLLIVVRRSATIGQFMKSGQELAAAEMLTLFISFLFFLGVIFMSRMFDDIRSSEKQYRLLIDNSHDIIYTFTLDGKISFVSPAWTSLMGHHPNQVLGQSLKSFIHPDDLAACSNWLKQIIEPGHGPGGIECRIRHANGSWRWFFSRAMVLRNEAGTITGIEGTAHDITERKRAEEALQSASHYSRTLIETSLDPLVTISAEGTITDVNVATEKITGVSRERLIGSDFMHYFTDPEMARAGYLKVFDLGQVIDYPLAIRHASGVVTEVLFNASVYRDERGTVLGVFAAARDITERKQAEEQIKSLLAEKEIILREVHHRIKNNMSIMMSMLSLQADLVEGKAAADVLKNAERRMQSMWVLYEKLYHADNLREMSVAEYLPSLAHEIISMFPDHSRVSLAMDIDDYRLSVKLLSPLGIIINELITNSMKYAFAGVTGGVITVSASTKEGLATIIFMDNGTGIPDSINIEQSPGFGLSLVHMLAQQMEGTIIMERTHGTKFVLSFKV